MKIIVSSQEEKANVESALYWIDRYLRKSGVEIFTCEEDEKAFDKLSACAVEVES